MRKLLPWLLGLTLACNFLTRGPGPTATVVPTAAPSPAPTASVTPVLPGLPFPAPRPGGPCPLSLQPDDVLVHPGPLLYSGDTVSLEVVADPSCVTWQKASVAVYADSANSSPLATAEVGTYGLGARAEATFTWIWDTTGRVGPQTLVVRATAPAVAPAVVTVTVNLLPADQRPQPEAVARWQTAQSACCIFHYLSQTAAARDLAQIEAEGDQARTRVEAKLGVTETRKLDVTLISRLLGHGGFAASGITLTYLDRNPVGNHLLTILTHEQTHLLDQQLARTKPALMTEGMAVYVAGGHFKPNENLPQRAAALLALGRYLPLGDLADNFYPAQHETGYLEGGAFITYLVDTYGWERYKRFYGSFKSGLPDRRMLDEALQANFGKGLGAVEADWLAALRALPPAPDEVENVRLTLYLYDSLRRYQRQDDPPAHYLTAWTPDTADAIRRGLTADYIRGPRAAESVALEAMLAAAQSRLEANDFPTTETLLDSINAVLDAHNLFFDPLAASYLQIVSVAAASGYEVQTITLQAPGAAADLAAATTATVTAIHTWPALETLTCARTAAGWQMAPAQP